jgi:hypothetical protein
MDDQAIIKYARKFTLPLPDTFIESNNIEAKDEMEIYRERVNGRDALIVIPKLKEQVIAGNGTAEKVSAES